MNTSIWEKFDIEDNRRILGKCIESSRALGELKGIAGSLALPEVTLNFIALKEATATSTLDGIKREYGEVYRAAVAKEGEYDLGIQTILRMYTALTTYSREAPTIANLEKVASCITGHPTKVRDTDIQDLCDKDQSIEFPKGDDVSHLLGQLIEFVTRDSGTDGLIKAIVAMLIFESIRPFERNGRMISVVFFHMILTYYGLTNGYEIILTPSVMNNEKEYFRKLHFAETSGQTGYWIEFMLDAIKHASFETMQSIFSINEVFRETCIQCSDLPFCNDTMVDVVFTNIYCKSAYLVDAGIAERVTAMKYLKTLEDRGLLKSEKVGREIVFRNVPLFDILCK